MPSASAIRLQVEAALAARIPSALTPAARVVRPVAPTGIDALDEALHGGLPVGAITELIGPECSGRTSVALAFVAGMTQAERVCAWIDVSNAFDPASAAAVGVDLRRLLWVRCGASKSESPQPETSLDGRLFSLPQRYLIPAPVIKGLHGGGCGGHPRREVKGMAQAVSGLLQPESSCQPNIAPRCAEPQRRDGSSLGVSSLKNNPAGARQCLTNPDDAGLVSGHDFSRAETVHQNMLALAPEGSANPIRQTLPEAPAHFAGSIGTAEQAAEQLVHGKFCNKGTVLAGSQTLVSQRRALQAAEKLKGSTVLKGHDFSRADKIIENSGVLTPEGGFQGIAQRSMSFSTTCSAPAVSSVRKITFSVSSKAVPFQNLPELSFSAGSKATLLQSNGHQRHVKPGQREQPGKPWARLDQALRTADLLLQGGGFSAIVLDMGSLAPEFASRVPLATWFRYRAAAESTQASLLLLAQYGCAKSSAELTLRLKPGDALRDEPTVFTGMTHSVEVARRRFTGAHDNVVPLRKPPQKADVACWQSRAAWAGVR